MKLILEDIGTHAGDAAEAIQAIFIDKDNRQTHLVSVVKHSVYALSEIQMHLGGIAASQLILLETAMNIAIVSCYLPMCCTWMALTKTNLIRAENSYEVPIIQIIEDSMKRIEASTKENFPQRKDLMESLKNMCYEICTELNKRKDDKKSQIFTFDVNDATRSQANKTGSEGNVKIVTEDLMASFVKKMTKMLLKREPQLVEYAAKKNTTKCEATFTVNFPSTTTKTKAAAAAPNVSRTMCRICGKKLYCNEIGSPDHLR